MLPKSIFIFFSVSTDSNSTQTPTLNLWKFSTWRLGEVRESQRLVWMVMGHTAAWCNALYLALSEAVGATRPPVSPRCRRLVSLHTESAAILYSSCRRLVVSMVNEAGCHTRGSRPINLQPSLPRHHPPNHSTSPTHTHILHHYALTRCFPECSHSRASCDFPDHFSQTRSSCWFRTRVWMSSPERFSGTQHNQTLMRR